MLWSTGKRLITVPFVRHNHMSDPLASYVRPQWEQLIRRLGGNLTLSDVVYDRLVAHYTASNRYYHTLSHVAGMLDLIDRIYIEVDNWNALQLAIWFHDVIYEVGTGLDNEQASADFSAEQLALLNLDPTLIETVSDLILDTKHKQRPATWDGQVLVDLDLAQLGGSAEQFQRDTDNIRREYASVPDKQFWSGRGRILQQFLNRSRIYYTAPFYTRFEATARRNLAQTIANIR